MSTELYRQMIAFHEQRGEPEALALQHQVWDATPWMVDAFTNGINSDRWFEMMKWLRDHFGPEAWPIHGKPGNWHSGGATVQGWTWIGFATEEMMLTFQKAWEPPNAEAREG